MKRIKKGRTLPGSGGLLGEADASAVIPVLALDALDAIAGDDLVAEADVGEESWKGGEEKEGRRRRE